MAKQLRAQMDDLRRGMKRLARDVKRAAVEIWPGCGRDAWMRRSNALCVPFNASSDGCRRPYGRDGPPGRHPAVRAGRTLLRDRPGTGRSALRSAAHPAVMPAA